MFLVQLSYRGPVFFLGQHFFPLTAFHHRLVVFLEEVGVEIGFRVADQPGDFRLVLAFSTDLARFSSAFRWAASRFFSSGV